jgi:hypothetical protein
VLSAGGSVALTADAISIGTRVLAPGGAVVLSAPQVDVSAGGLLSARTDSTTLFGQVQGGFDWVYSLPDGRRVYDGDLSRFPEKSVSIQAGTIAVAAGARIDVSGGRDLLGYEWVPGPGGTVDALDNAAFPNRFAILPDAALRYAPYDPRESPGANLKAGDSVYLSGAPGLAEGTYTLLPARYALLPGALLVTPTAGFQDLPLGQTIAQADGSVVVSGYRTHATVSVRDARTSGFSIRDEQGVARLAQYTVTSANAFLAAAAGTPRGTGFLLNHAIAEFLPGPDRAPNADPITGQAAWYDLRVRLEKCQPHEIAETSPRPPTLATPPGLAPAPSILRYNANAPK